MMGKQPDIAYGVRRALVTIAPLTHVYTPSLTRDGLLRRYLLPNYITDAMLPWQLLFIGLIFLGSLIAFECRDI